MSIGSEFVTHTDLDKRILSASLCLTGVNVMVSFAVY